MRTLKGIVASPGLAKGTACLYSERLEESFSHYVIDEDKVENEILRLKEALKKAKTTMEGIVQTTEKSFDKSISEIFKAHLMLLDDPILTEKMVELIKNRFINAEHAVSDAFEEYIQMYERNNLYFGELSHDIKDVRDRLLTSFGEVSTHFECPESQRHQVVVVSENMTTSMVAHIPKHNVLAFVTKEGGFTNHATILARSYNVPVIFGIDVEGNINCGDKIIVDGSQGTVFVMPDEATYEYYSHKIEDIKRKKIICEAKKDEPSYTKEGLRITIKANISTPGEMELVRNLDYDGIGLLRTEFLFLDKEIPPSEEEQLKMYRHILRKTEGHPVVIRLLDLGWDKRPNYLHIPQQDKQHLDIRGARALEFYYETYLTQIKAILRASVFGDLRILYPMVADMNDINTFRNMVAKAKAILKKERKKFNENIREGIMIETPAAAIMAHDILGQVDFANIGSNDLLQYTLAASREDPSVEQTYHILHPSLAKFIEIIVKAGNYHNKEVCLCGEIASFEEFYPFFLSLGLKSFSVATSKLADIKCEISHLEKPSESLPRRFYSATTKEEIDKLFFEIKK